MAKKVTIFYKSGAKVVFPVQSFTVIKDAMGALQSVKWTDLGARSKSSPMFIGVDHIESIWEGEV